MKHAGRFILNILTPTPLAALLLVVFFAVQKNTPPLSKLPAAFLGLTLMGYIFAILPSLAHAWWLHRRYRAGLDPRSLRAAGISTVSGALAGLAIGLVFAFDHHDPSGPLRMFVPLGAAAGALNGLLHFLIPAR